MNDIKKIGFIGLGNMGVPMVKNLAKAGYDVMVYNRTAEKAYAVQAETGVKVAERATDLVQNADLIISMLTNDAAVKEIYEGPEGLFQAVKTEGLIIVDMSTVSPETTRELARSAGQHGISYLDAPVSGSVKPAAEGQLVIMAGGEPGAFNRVKPVLELLGKSATLLGGHGSGNVAKLAINLFLGITIQGLSEATLFASRNGISPEALLPLINSSAVGSGITKIKSENIIHGDYNAAFALKLLRKDLGLAVELGMKTVLGTAVSETYQKAMEDGFADQDMVAVYKYLEKSL
jgi:3-hydroxyisobutyrate dehydrogenase